MLRCVCAAMVLFSVPAAAETNAYGTPWPSGFPELCIDGKLQLFAPPCRKPDVAYIDHLRVLHFLRHMPSQAQAQRHQDNGRRRLHPVFGAVTMRIEQAEVTTIILKPVTRAEIDELERILQSGIPPGWTITCLVALHGEHHDLTGYELQAGFETIRIGPEGQAEPPDGWEIKRIGGAFSNEISITAPGGLTVLIYDTLLA